MTIAYCRMCSAEWPETYRDKNNEQTCPYCGAGKLNRGTPQPPSKNSAAAALGKLGGTARAQSLSADERSAIAKKAADARWGVK